MNERDDILRRFVIEYFRGTLYVHGGRHEIVDGGLCCYGLVRRIAMLRGYVLPVTQVELMRRRDDLARQVGLEARLRPGDVVVCDPLDEGGASHLVTMLTDQEGAHIHAEHGFVTGRLARLARARDAYRLRATS